MLKMFYKLFRRSRKQQDELIKKAFAEGWNAAATLSQRKCIRDVGMMKDKVTDIYERGRMYNDVEEAWTMFSISEDL